MIEIKLANLSEILGKNISQIARETGINRNTITAIFHNKVDGIKFSTLNKLCEIYKIDISDILEFSASQNEGSELPLLYKQEGEIVPFTMFPPLMSINNLDENYFSGKYFGQGCAYCKDEYGQMYWQKNSLYDMAEYVYNNLVKTNKIDDLYSDFLISAKKIEDTYDNLDIDKINNYDNKNLKSFFDDVWKKFEKFWSLSIFIDGFDSGFDQEKINEIAKKNDFTVQEVGVLTTPLEMTFNNERLYELLKIVKKIKSKKISKDRLDVFLKKYVQENSGVRKYIKKFDYYKSNYSRINHIQSNEVEKELKKYLLDNQLFKEEYNKLVNYSQNQKKEVSDILKNHKLNSNPLEFFAKLTYWRELRKAVNLMSIYVLFAILESIERKTGITIKYLKYLSFDEVDNILRGLIDRNILKSRYENGVLVTVDGHDYKIVEGKQAKSLRDDLEKRLAGNVENETITGFVASQGYAKGIARIVLDQKDFGKLKEGEILITGMTRPEFVPVMKKAGAIVTNEGGITCHAAIVSRELGKPCIIGTQNATKLIHDGDLIEVRANHGTVRILEKK